jgi:hypothetical protein
MILGNKNVTYNLKNFQVVKFMIISICFIVFDEVFPLWSLTSPSVGGLGFRSSQIGVALGISKKNNFPPFF